MKNAIRLSAVLGWFLVCFTAHAAPVLQVNTSGQLTGATGVQVGAVFYDVSFYDGLCPFAYGECSGSVPLAFTSEIMADNASQALLEYVFVDGPQGNFDTTLSTFGCASAGILFCRTITPWGSVGSDFRASIATNEPSPSPGPSTYYTALIPMSLDSAIEHEDLVWAVWVPAAAVPGPGALSCLGLGLLALVSRRRRPST